MGTKLRYATRGLGLASLLLAGALVGAACAGGTETQGAPANAGGTAGADSGTDGSSAAGGSGGEVGGDYVFVSPLGNDNADGKSATAPVQTLGEGLQRAAGCGVKPCEVRVMAGTYSEQLKLVNGVRIVGGYAPGFTSQDTEANPVIITSTDARTIIAEDLTEPTSLESLTVQGADLSATAGAGSSYAIWVKDSGDALKLVDTTVLGGKAAPGAPGAAGSPVPCAALGGTAGGTADCSSDAGGPGGASGDPLSGGEGGPDGQDNCPNACPLVGGDGVSGGTTGTDGGDGGPGLPGAISLDGLGAFDSTGLWLGALGMSGERGKHGTGGGGGGGGGTKRIRACFGCNDALLGGPGGAGGDGGCGGGGGAPGGAGGGSFGVVLLNSNLTLQGGYLAGGRGGDGGPGGAGADGTAGGNGEGGADGSSQRCGAITYFSAGGGNGGDGGRGGPGGGGAGGNGGVSIAIALLGSSQLIEQEGVLIDRGTPGAGGPGGVGGNDAQPGVSGEVWGQKAFSLAAP